MKDFIKRAWLKKESDTFTFSNIDPIPKIFALYASDYVFKKGIPYASPNKDLPTNQELDYIQLVNDKNVVPKKINRIRIIADDASQFDFPFIWNFTDANGNYYSVSDQPLNMLSPMQFQKRVIDMQYDNLIIGNSEFLAWNLLPGKSVTITIWYEDFRLENLLSINRKTLIKK